MARPTEADVAVLRTIYTLTRDSGGQPPTLREVAEALGLSASSRSNIQRQLTRLRPTYADWTTSPRSLRLSLAGMALLGAETTEYPPGLRLESEVLPEVVLVLLATGVLAMASKIAEGKPLPEAYRGYGYPVAWRRGLNLLAAEMLKRGRTDLPVDTPHALDLCRKPLATWSVRFAGVDWADERSLLDGDTPTEFAYELSGAYLEIGGNPELQLSEQQMKLVLETARNRGWQREYVAFRRYVIEHPVVLESEVLSAALRPDFHHLGHYLNTLYEAVPLSLFYNGEGQLCGYCGWPLERVDGLWHCEDSRCAVMTDGFKNKRPLPSVEAGHTLMRVRPAIRRYVVVPGRYDVETYDRLLDLGLDAELWPVYDTFDVSMRFADDELWAIDLKDWRYPHLLAHKLIATARKKPAFERPPGYEWSRAMFVVPDERIREDRDYLTVLRNRAAAALGRAEVMTVSQLMEDVRRKQARLVGGAGKEKDGAS